MMWNDVLAMPSPCDPKLSTNQKDEGTYQQHLPKIYPGIFKVVEVTEVAPELLHGCFVNEFPTYNLLLTPHGWLYQGRHWPILNAFGYLTNETLTIPWQQLVQVKNILQARCQNVEMWQSKNCRIPYQVSLNLHRNSLGSWDSRWRASSSACVRAGSSWYCLSLGSVGMWQTLATALAPHPRILGRFVATFQALQWSALLKPESVPNCFDIVNYQHGLEQMYCLSS